MNTWNEKGPRTGMTYPVFGGVIAHARDDLDRVDRSAAMGSSRSAP